MNGVHPGDLVGTVIAIQRMDVPSEWQLTVDIRTAENAPIDAGLVLRDLIIPAARVVDIHGAPADDRLRLARAQPSPAPAAASTVIFVIEVLADATLTPAPLVDPSPFILSAPLSGLPSTAITVGFVLDHRSASGSPLPPLDPRASAASDTTTPAPSAPADVLDYLARDFAGLREMMQGRLAQHLPSDAAAGLNNVADPLMAIVDVLAMTGDYLSYYQDAVGTEAYLTKARRRLSVARHARLMDFVLHDGCNARTWLAVQVSTDLLLPLGTSAVTTQPGAGVSQLPLGYPLASETVVFETMETLPFFTALNDLGQSLTPGTLIAGSCSATLDGSFPDLSPGRALIFEIQDLTAGGRGQQAHAVRLVNVERIDPANGAPRTIIQWHPEDALTFPIAVPAGGAASISLYANVVLADHGTTNAGLGLVPAVVQDPGDYHPQLTILNPTYAAPAPEPTFLSIPPAGAGVDVTAYRRLLTPLAPGDNGGPAILPPSATASLRSDPRDATPQLVLTGSDGLEWTAVRDLLGANDFTRAFVVEPAGEGARQDNTTGQAKSTQPVPTDVTLRFGDGTLGRRPPAGTTFTATLREGNGPQGNVKANLITQILTSLPPLSITWASNPVPAGGGTAAEATREAQVFAPTAYRRMLRAASTGDVERLSRLSPLVRDVTAARIDGAEPGFRVCVQLAPASPESLIVFSSFLEPFRIWDTSLLVAPPARAGVDIVLAVYFRPHADAGRLRGRLTERLAQFFHPSSWRPGQAVYLSELTAALASDPEVSWINTDPVTDPRITFGRFDTPRSGFALGRIDIEPWAVVSTDNDVAHPEHGRTDFYLIPDR